MQTRPDNQRTPICPSNLHYVHVLAGGKLTSTRYPFTPFVAPLNIYITSGALYEQPNIQADARIMSEKRSELKAKLEGYEARCTWLNEVFNDIYTITPAHPPMRRHHTQTRARMYPPAPSGPRTVPPPTPAHIPHPRLHVHALCTHAHLSCTVSKECMRNNCEDDIIGIVAETLLQ